MVDDQNSNDIPADDPQPEQDPQSSETADDQDDEPRFKHKRPVYEPTLFKDKKRFRVPRLLAIPALVIICGVLFYFLVIVPKQRRHFVTVGKIVICEDPGKSGQTHLYLVNNDGTGQVQITSGKHSDSQPAFAPDGNQIAFVSNEDDPSKQLYVVDPNGLNRTQLTRNTGVKESPAFSPSDYDTLGYTDAGILEMMNVSTLASTRLLPPAPKKNQANADTTTNANIGKAITSFAWSPGKDQSKQGIAAVEETNEQDQLLLQPTLAADPIVSTDGTLTGPPLVSAQTMSIAWSPDGNTIAVAMLGINGLPNGTQMSGVLFMDRQGHPINTPPLFNLPNAQTGPQSPVYSIDGTKMVCQIVQQADVATTRVGGLAMAKVDGSVPPKMAIRGDISDPKFSPDGQFLYFIGLRRDGGHDLLRADMTKGSVTRISDGTADVVSYDVSPQLQK